jgi:chemotaxis protein CheZ
MTSTSVEETTMADIDDVDALFDLAASGAIEGPLDAPTPATSAADADAGGRAMFQRIGQLTRVLHDALHELGYDRDLSAAAQALPDARDRLSYIATLTGQAADRVLNAVERCQADQLVLEGDVERLAARWASFDAAATDCRALADDTRTFLQRIPGTIASERANLLEIMMAQDFHDLTGQVIKRIADIAHSLEGSLLQLLLETRPPDVKPATMSLGGPAIHASADSVRNQGEVDQLLDSLGF